MGFRYQPPAEEGEDLGPPPGPFRFRPRSGFRIPGGLIRWGGALIVLLLIFAALSILKGIYADFLWFDTVQDASGQDYSSVYRLQVVTRLWLFFAGAGIFIAFFGGNLIAAHLIQSRSGSRLDIDLGEFGNVRRIALIVGIAVVLFLALIFGAQAGAQWDKVLLFMNSEPFGLDDPAFDKDIGFYVFELPLLNFIMGWALGIVVLTTIVVTAYYAFRLLVGGSSASTPPLARPHVALLLVTVIGLFTWRYWLGRFDLVYSERGAAFGAAYTDINAQLPVIYVLMGFAVVTAVAILISAFRRGLVALPIGAAVIWAVAAIAGGLIYPATVQRFQVEPNELAKESEFIERNLKATREAYGIDPAFGAEGIDEEDFPARAQVTAAEINGNPETTGNIRLWDSRPLLQTLDQLQAIRPLYDFLDVDVDRYEIDGEVRQVMLAARELNPDQLPEDARSWVNQRLQFTHGFGLAMIPVNEIVETGLPEFFVQDIPPSGDIEIEQPRIYYGEMPDHYVIVNSDEEEFDFPVGEDRETTVFEGGGGVKIDSLLRRFVYAWEFGDTNILISDAINDESRLLYERNIHDRIEKIAPFLRLDSDPYLVVAEGRMFWMQDAYTVTDRYPYSTRNSGLNYIRNSVKVVVDAFDGATTFYLIEPEDDRSCGPPIAAATPPTRCDPIVAVYEKIYPDLFTDFDEMPAALQEHIRYPQDLFQIQTQIYRRYHIDVDKPAIFFNREDIWDIPTELFIDQEQPVEPYYVTMRLPGEAEEEFALIMPFRPANRNNTIAWLAARSDGDQYGKLLAFRFPTDTFVFGPSQIESRIDQDTTISQQISLWNQSGSQVIRGNLLMIPIGEANLFVEPIYLQATASSLPELKRVIVVNGNDIAMEPTLEEALDVILGRAEPTLPTLEDLPDVPVDPDATPQPDETPEAEDTPDLGPTPEATPILSDDVEELIRQANEAFEAAQERLAEGDFAGYGEEIDLLAQILAQLAELTEP